MQEQATQDVGKPAADRIETGPSLEGPIFKLTFEDGRVLRYEPHRSLLADESGMPISLERLNLGYMKARHESVPRVSPTMPGLKGPVRRLKISMGFKCNYSCSYCSQAFHRYVDKKRKPGDLERFVEKIEKLIPTENKGRGARIEFWGGEPFVYWSIFKPLAESLRERYPEADFMTITNGSMLDDEKIEWLDRLRFGVGLSHDGPGYKFRGADPLDDPKKRENILKLVQRLAPSSRFSFNCVLSLPNPSLRAIYEHLEKALGLSGFLLSSEGVTSQYEPAVAPLVPKNMDEMRTIWRQVFLDACNEKMIRFSSTVKETMTDFFLSLAHGRPAESVGQKCGMDRADHVAVDLDGNVTTCQNVSANAGHGIGTMDKLEDVRLTTAKHWSNFENCRNCAVVQLCKGSCMYMDGETRKPVCDGHFTFYFGLLAASLYVLTGQRLSKIEGKRVRLAGHTKVEF